MYSLFLIVFSLRCLCPKETHLFNANLQTSMALQFTLGFSFEVFVAFKKQLISVMILLVCTTYKPWHQFNTVCILMSDAL